MLRLVSVFLVWSLTFQVNAEENSTTHEEESAAPIETVDQLESKILEILKENNTPGMIGAIVSGDDVIWQGALGIADRSDNQPVTVDTLFRMGSISKSFVALSVLRMRERGEVSLDLVINDFVPEAGAENDWASTDPIRLYHVMEHTAGFDDIHFRDFAVSDPSFTTLSGLQFNHGSKVSRWRPGTRMSYANIGPPIAALVIEKIAGMTFEEFVDEEVFSPLGMETATFFYDEKIAASYAEDGTTVKPYIHIPVRPSGSLNASSGDMIRLLKMYIGRGMISGDRYIKTGSLDRMETPTSTLAAKQGQKVGYGLGNYTSQKGGFVMHGHNGGIDGFSSSYAYFPDEKIGIFYSINAGNRVTSRAVSDAIFKFATRGLQPLVPVSWVTVSEEEIAPFEGYYEPNSPRPELARVISTTAGVFHVSYENETLTLDPLFGGESTGYLSVGQLMFRKEGDALPSLMFVESVDGERLVQGNNTSMQVSAVYVYLWLSMWVFISLMMLSAFLFAPVWVIRSAFGKLTISFPQVRTLPLLTSFVFVTSVIMVMLGASANAISNVSIYSIGYFLGSIVFAILSLVTPVYILLKRESMEVIGRAVWIHSLLVSIGCLLLMLLWWSHGLIGIRFWVY